MVDRVFGTHFCVICLRTTKLHLKNCRSRGKPLATRMSDLAGPRFEPKTSRSRDERVSARPTLEGSLVEAHKYNRNSCKSTRKKKELHWFGK